MGAFYTGGTIAKGQMVTCYYGEICSVKRQQSFTEEERKVCLALNGWKDDDGTQLMMLGARGEGGCQGARINSAFYDIDTAVRGMTAYEILTESSSAVISW